MNIFVLCTGRCGSTTFTKACQHATNVTAGHETRSSATGKQRLAYPANHIETDNRLAFIIGRLEQEWGTNARYVHLYRDPEETAQSYAKRITRRAGIVRAWHSGFLMRGDKSPKPVELARDLVTSMTANIELFLRDKDFVEVRLEHAAIDFERFWQWAGLEGDLHAALSEWDVRHNAS